MAELVFTRGAPLQHVLFRWPLRTRQVSIGHRPGNDFTLPASSGPPLQLSVAEMRDARFHLSVHDGGNVPINGNPANSQTLADGDTIQLGELLVIFLDGGQNAARRRTYRRAAALEPTNARTYVEFNHRRTQVTEAGVRVGSDPDCDVCLEDHHVSQHHALLVRRKGVITIQDLGSTNGTRINDVRITAAEAPPNAQLDIGGVKLQLLTIVEPTEQDGVAVQRVGALLYVDPAMDAVAKKIHQVAPKKATVWISGESGVGKELVARAIHDVGPRANKPFVGINCAALPANLIESELFGHERGAFTSADKPRLGAFEEAGEGTLFLDEIGELPKEMQAKLLRALESMTIRRVGGTGDRPIHCRILVATHQNLQGMVAAGHFRQDLFQRISSLPIVVPALVDRPLDIPLLARHLLAECEGTATLTPAAMEKLKGYHWPGNVREMRNVLMRATTFAESPSLDAKNIELLEQHGDTGRPVYSPGRTLEDIDRQAIQDAVRVHRTIKKAADELGISRRRVRANLAEPVAGTADAQDDED